MLTHCLQHWPNIKKTLVYPLSFTGVYCTLPPLWYILAPIELCPHFYFLYKYGWKICKVLAFVFLWALSSLI